MIESCARYARPQHHRSIPDDDLSSIQHAGGNSRQRPLTRHTMMARVGDLPLGPGNAPQRAQAGWPKALDPGDPLKRHPNPSRFACLDCEWRCDGATSRALVGCHWKPQPVGSKNPDTASCAIRSQDDFPLAMPSARLLLRSARNWVRNPWKTWPIRWALQILSSQGCMNILIGQGHGPCLLNGGYEDEAQCDSNLSPSPLLKHYQLYEPFEQADGGRASRLDLLRLYISAIKLMQH